MYTRIVPWCTRDSMENHNIFGIWEEWCDGVDEMHYDDSESSNVKYVYQPRPTAVSVGEELSSVV